LTNLACTSTVCGAVQGDRAVGLSSHVYGKVGNAGKAGCQIRCSRAKMRVAARGGAISLAKRTAEARHHFAHTDDCPACILKPSQPPPGWCPRRRSCTAL
jgi:hypothetical protein